MWNDYFEEMFDVGSGIFLLDGVIVNADYIDVVEHSVFVYS
jgi:hypothetical protein